MKKLIVGCLLLACGTCHAGTYRCTDSARHTYTASQNVPSDKCVLVAAENPYPQQRAIEATARAVLQQGGARIGMTSDEIIDSSWGKPARVHRTTTAYGASEQWVYKSGNALYFENGVLTAIQN